MRAAQTSITAAILRHNLNNQIAADLAPPVFRPAMCPTSTPWGHADSRDCLAPGLWTVSTPGHGGYWMSPARADHFRATFPTFDGYAPLPWLEEDLDCCAAVVLFAPELRHESVFYAVEAVTSYKSTPRGEDYGTDAPEVFYFGIVREWLLGPEGERARTMAASFAASIKGKWRRGSMSGDSAGWRVQWTREGDNARAVTLEPDYPRQNWRTDEEINARRQPDQAPAVVVHHSSPVCAIVSPEVAAAFGLDKLPPELVRVEPAPWDESQCSGAFDGFTVTSDADPGL